MPEHKKPQGPAKPTWHQEAERRLLLVALQNEPPKSDRERFLTPISARRENELLGQVKPEEVKP